MSLFNSGIRPAVDAHLLKLAEEKRDYGDYWSASSAGYCMRRNIFERLKVPHVKDDPRKQRVFTVGHIFHEFMQRITKEAGLSIAQELELEDSLLMVRGHIDDLVLVEEVADVMLPGMSGIKQNLILYDYKSQSSRAFSYKRPNMSYYHKMQLGTYMYMLRKNPSVIIADQKPLIPSPNPVTISTDGNPKLRLPTTQEFDLTEARILKISKDDLRMTEEQLLWSPELESEVKYYWARLNSCWDDVKGGRGLPSCTCADHEGGFLAKEAYNPFYFDGEPCSTKLYDKLKKEQK